MNPWIGWTLAVIGTAAAYARFGWHGVVVAVSVIAFWLLLQFSRALRVMRQAAEAPKGRIGSAVMVQSRLRRGLRLMDVIQLTGSLGERLEGETERWRWTDEGGAQLTLTFVRGRCAEWDLSRPQ